MDPISAILLAAPSIISLISGLTGGGQNPTNKYGSASDFTNINPETAKFLENLSGRQQNADNMIKELMAGSGRYEGQASSYLQQLAGTKPSATFDPNAGFTQFLAQNPALQDVINNSTGTYADPENLRGLQAELRRSATNALPTGSGGSGAIAKAAASAFAQPLFQIAQEGQAQRSQASSSALNNLLGITNQNEATRYNADRQGFLDNLDVLSRAFQGASGLASFKSGQADNVRGYLSNLLQMNASLATPEYFSPTYGVNPNYMSTGDQAAAIGTGLGGLGALTENQQFQQLMSSLFSGASA